MNREIKFRAWVQWDAEASSLGQWLEPDSLMVCGDGEILETCNPIESLGAHKVFIMQYTGLKDKNGTEIYEGDILLIADENYTPYPPVSVIFKAGAFRDSYWEYVFNFKKWQIEVIGNIYENPELVKS